MPKTITFVPRCVAQAMDGKRKTILSITHPGEIADVDHFESVYRLAFDDTETPCGGLVMFDMEMAAGVIRLLDAGYPYLVVHCEAGMSRSAAVAFWASERRDYRLIMHQHGVGTVRHHNKHVFRTLDAADGRDMAAYYAEIERQERMMGD